MRLIYLGYFIQIKIRLINSKFNKKKEQQNLKNSKENKNRTSNDNCYVRTYTNLKRENIHNKVHLHTLNIQEKFILIKSI